jgi:hypothetical protein
MQPKIVLCLSCFYEAKEPNWFPFCFFLVYHCVVQAAKEGSPKYYQPLVFTVSLRANNQIGYLCDLLSCSQG